MRKLWFSLLLLFAVLLSACAGAPGSAATPTTTGGTGQGIPTEDTKAVKMECKLVGSVVATPDATAVAKFPPTIAGDWAKGNPNASLKVIEYSDYM